MKIVFDDNTPIYLQIMAYIKNEIVAGSLKANQRLPSIRDLADELEVTPNTVQRVYRELEYESLSYSERGTGSYITGDPAAIESLKQRLIRDEVARFLSRMGQFGLTDDQILEHVVHHQEGRESSHVDNP